MGKSKKPDSGKARAKLTLELEGELSPESLVELTASLVGQLGSLGGKSLLGLPSLVDVSNIGATEAKKLAGALEQLPGVSLDPASFVRGVTKSAEDTRRMIGNIFGILTGRS